MIFELSAMMIFLGVGLVLVLEEVNSASTTSICSWFDAQLDLCPLMNEVIDCRFLTMINEELEYTSYLSVTPFEDNLMCDGQPSMAILQRSISSSSNNDQSQSQTCVNLAQQNNSIAPQTIFYQTQTQTQTQTQAWNFIYDRTPTTKTELIFVCKMGAIPYDYESLKCSADGKLNTAMVIETQYACASSSSSTNTNTNTAAAEAQVYVTPNTTMDNSPTYVYLSYANSSYCEVQYSQISLIGPCLKQLTSYCTESNTFLVEVSSVSPVSSICTITAPLLAVVQVSANALNLMVAFYFDSNANAESARRNAIYLPAEVVVEPVLSKSHTVEAVSVKKNTHLVSIALPFTDGLRSVSVQY